MDIPLKDVLTREIIQEELARVEHDPDSERNQKIRRMAKFCVRIASIVACDRYSALGRGVVFDISHSKSALSALTTTKSYSAENTYNRLNLVSCANEPGINLSMLL